jgi:hypothetical protein
LLQFFEGRVPLRVSDVHCHGTADLIQVAPAHRRQSSGFGSREGRQEQRGQNADNGDDNQQFQERKASPAEASATCA